MPLLSRLPRKSIPLPDTPAVPWQHAVKVAAVIPAFNEAGRIESVLRALTAAPGIDDIVVISDGSTDNTCAIAQATDGVRAFQLPRNKGKGGAMREGAERTDADVLVFFDADLIGLTPEKVSALIAPVCKGEAHMATGVFKGGRFATDIAQFFSPGITGQRAIRRDIFLSIPDLDKVGYGIELAINFYVRHHGFHSKKVVLPGVTHPMKEEKLGLVRGAASRAVMYWQMLRFRITYDLHGRPPHPRETPEEENPAPS